MDVDYRVASFYGGTGLLIVISVALDLVQEDQQPPGHAELSRPDGRLTASSEISPCDWCSSAPRAAARARRPSCSTSDSGYTDHRHRRHSPGGDRGKRPARPEGEAVSRKRPAGPGRSGQRGHRRPFSPRTTGRRRFVMDGYPRTLAAGRGVRRGAAASIPRPDRGDLLRR